VVAGEASGDQLAALTIRHLPGPTVGCGGQACLEQGMELIQHIRDFSTMGLSAVVPKLATLYQLKQKILHKVSKQRIRRALLVNFTSFNYRLGLQLKQRGVDVTWCVAPQIWAWRSHRIHRFHNALHRLAVLFPFEVPLFQQANYQVHWVGHPAANTEPLPHSAACQAWQFTDNSREPQEIRILLLPGSRGQELRNHLPLLVQTVSQLRRVFPHVQVRLGLAPSLPSELIRYAHQRCLESQIPTCTVSQPLVATSHIFDLAIAVSGTATLECALANLPVIVIYQTDPVTAWIGQRLLQTPYIGLPNILLGNEAYPELLQHKLHVDSLVKTSTSLLEIPSVYERHGAYLRDLLRGNDGKTMGQRVAELMLSASH
jgi:lipid-A-disaccharide synthase